MSSNITNQVAYLRTSREFPEDLHQLCVEVNKSYLDIANSVNERIIGLFPTNRPAVTGESWFLQGNRRQQTLRQAYNFTSTGNIAHGIGLSGITNFTRGFGSYTDGTNQYGVIFGTNVAIAGEVSFYVTSTNIVVLAGVGAPAITRGIIVIEWLSQA